MSAKRCETPLKRASDTTVWRSSWMHDGVAEVQLLLHVTLAPAFRNPPGLPPRHRGPVCPLRSASQIHFSSFRVFERVSPESSRKQRRIPLETPLTSLGIYVGTSSRWSELFVIAAQRRPITDGRTDGHTDARTISYVVRHKRIEHRQSGGRYRLHCVTWHRVRERERRRRRHADRRRNVRLERERHGELRL